jgi:hypothetical protein
MILSVSWGTRIVEDQKPNVESGEGFEGDDVADAPDHMRPRPGEKSENFADKRTEFEIHG